MTDELLLELNDQGDRVATMSAATKVRLREIFTQGARISAGSIQLIGLTALRTELGDRWDTVKQRVYNQTERLLNKYLSPSDVWLRADASNYVVVFSVPDRQACELICGRIVADLHKVMLGSSDTSRITVHSIVRDIDGNIAVQATSLDQLLARVLSHQSAVVATDPAHSASHGHVATAVDHAPVDFRPGICFRPVFDVHHKVLSTFVCRADSATKNILFASRRDRVLHEEYLFQTDMEILIQSIETYTDLYRNSFRYMQNLSVNFSTFAIGRYRRDFLTRCQAIPAYLIPFMVFALEGLPPGVPHGRIAEIVSVLKPYSRAVLALIDDDIPDFALLSQVGIRGVGVEVRPGEPQSRAAKRIMTIGSQVRRQGMFFYVDGIRSAELLHIAEEAGAAYLAGPLVGCDTDVPEHMKHVTERELIRKSGQGPLFR